MLDRLLKAGADINAQTHDGETPLHLILQAPMNWPVPHKMYKTYKTHAEMALGILKHNPNLNLRDIEGHVPDFWVSQWGHVELSTQVIAEVKRARERNYYQARAITIWN